MIPNDVNPCLFLAGSVITPTVIEFHVHFTLYLAHLPIFRKLSSTYSGQNKTMANPLIPSVSTLSFLLELLHEYTIDTYLPPVKPTPSGFRNSISDPSTPLPTKSTIELAKSKIIQTISGPGIGLESTVEHLVEDIVPALGRSSLSSRYYGFVTGKS